MSGKTTLGKALAQNLHWNFIDTDILIEKAYRDQTCRQCSCRQIFIEEGEAYFRAFEKQQIASIKSLNNVVVALGGGALEDPENIDILKGIGRLIYLKTPFEVLWGRVRRQELPAYLDRQNPKEDYYALAKKRTPLYEHAADEIFETDGLTLQEAVDVLYNASAEILKGQRT